MTDKNIIPPSIIKNEGDVKLGSSNQPLKSISHDVTPVVTPGSVGPIPTSGGLTLSSSSSAKTVPAIKNKKPSLSRSPTVSASKPIFSVTPSIPPTSSDKTSSSSSGVTSIRPYRSRRQRPCDYCRRRKMRCEMVQETMCLQCQKNRTTCTFLNQPIKRKKLIPTASSDSVDDGGDGMVVAGGSSGNNGDSVKSIGGGSVGTGTPNSVDSTQSPSTVTTVNSTITLHQQHQPLSQHPQPTSGSLIEVPPMEPPSQIEALMEEHEPPLVPEGYHSAALLGLSGDQDPYLLQYYNYDETDQTSSFIKHALRRVSDDPAMPVQFLAFNDERGRTVEDERAAQLERIDRLAGKFEEQLLALYFRFVHPTYPIVDKMIFYRDYYYSKKSINPGLLSGLLALSCVWWKYDSILCVNSIPPDLSEELYNECEIAVNRDIKYPNLSTVQALLLLLQKRLLMDQTAETYSVSVDIARLISVSQNLGLHLNCSNWNIPPSVKRLREKLWATIYIMEKWTSVNAGRPSLLVSANSTNDLYDSDDPTEQLFIYLGRLTSILDGIIQQLYSVRYVEAQYYNMVETQNKVDHFFDVIEIWRNELPDDIKDMQCTLPGQFCKNGTLHLAALTVEILLHRIRLRPICSNLPRYPEYRAHAAEAIQRVIQFTLEITHSHLHAFWYSMTHLNFSTIAHFVFYHHLTSPTSQEYGETRDTLRKWLWALRVLSQGWEEGTGLATLRMDTVFWMGKNLFASNYYGAHHNNDNNNDNNDNNTNNNFETGNNNSSENHDDNTDSIDSNDQQNEQHQNSNNGHNHNHHHHHHHIEPPLAWYDNQGSIEPYHDSLADPHHHPQYGGDVDHMLLLNEDIMPQNEQIDHFLGHEVPDNLANAYSEYFDHDSDQGMLTQELHDVLAVPEEGIFHNDINYDSHRH